MTQSSTEGSATSTGAKPASSESPGRGTSITSAASTATWSEKSGVGWWLTMIDRSDETGLNRIVCEECGEYPQAYWCTGTETIALVCNCGERMLPRDAVMEHDLMPEGTSWTVIDDDAPSTTGGEQADE